MLACTSTRRSPTLTWTFPCQCQPNEPLAYTLGVSVMRAQSMTDPGPRAWDRNASREIGQILAAMVDTPSAEGQPRPGRNTRPIGRRNTPPTKADLVKFQGEAR